MWLSFKLRAWNLKEKGKNKAIPVTGREGT
jgi:hypothetical protein